jgi:hypothetical protein
MLVWRVKQIEYLEGGQTDARTGACSLKEPLMSSSRWQRLRGRGPELYNWFAAASDHDLLTVQGAIDQLGKLVLGHGDTVRGHGVHSSNMAIDIATSTTDVHRCAGNDNAVSFLKYSEEPDRCAC